MISKNLAKAKERLAKAKEKEKNAKLRQAKAKHDTLKSKSPFKNIGKTVETLSSFIDIIHILIKFLPLGLYFFAYFSATLFKDIRSAFLLMGLIFNDIIGYLYKKYNKGVNNPKCNMFTSSTELKQSGGGDEADKENNYYGEFLQNPHTEIISFVTSFFYSDMFYKQKLDIFPFITLTIMLFLTIWSRMDQGCETNFNIVILNIILGAIYGTIFYFFIRKRYIDAEKGLLEKETCELGLNNYRCDEIKDGTVIIKDNKNISQNTDNDEDDTEDDSDF
jgi:hypothetical protein